MKVPPDVRCFECGQIFCCGDCRRRHEANAHGRTFDCRLCRRDVLTLRCGSLLGDGAPLLDHLRTEHLPLRCVKCGKVYDTMEDLCDGELCRPTRWHDKEDEAVAVTQDKISPGNNLAVITSTPTHPCIKPPWGLFQKSFTSTISVINSPDSDVQGSPIENNPVTTSSNQISSIHADSATDRKVQDPKGILAKHSTPVNVESEDSSDCSPLSVNGKGPSSNAKDAGNLKASIAGDDSGGSSFAEKRKRVTFADQPTVNKIGAVKPHVFVKPKRASTPMRYKPKRHRTPRFQAIINNFESRSAKFQTTPENPKSLLPTKPPVVGDETPPSTDTNANGIIAARTIDFKQDSPTTSEDLNVNEELSSEKSQISPAIGDVTNLDHYKSCLVESPPVLTNDIIDASKLETVDDLPKQIAKSIQQTLSKALDSQEFSTEIQFNIVITKKVVSIREKMNRTKDNDDFNHTTRSKESTTVWSRLFSGLKWVLWGDKGSVEDGNQWKNPRSPNSAKRKRPALLPPPLSSSNDSLLDESPVSKRYRYAGRISGRRPLDRVLKGESLAMVGRSNSFHARLQGHEDEENRPSDRDEPLNRSF